MRCTQTRLLLLSSGLLLTLVLLYATQHQPLFPLAIPSGKGGQDKSPNVERETQKDLSLVRDSSREDPKLLHEKWNQDDPKLVDYVKTHLLTPPSSSPYNLSSTNGNYTSQYGQNLKVLALLRNKRNGFFVECGALDGEYLSNSLLLEKEFGWRGLLIEANPALGLQLRNKHRKAWTSTACLSTQPFSQVMEFGLDSPATSGLVKGWRRLSKAFASTIPVLCIPLHTYLLALNISLVDYLSLDVEGADLDVLRTIPFHKVTFRVIEVEVVLAEGGKAAFRDLLQSHGYVLAAEIWPDYIFIHPSLVP